MSEYKYIVQNMIISAKNFDKMAWPLNAGGLLCTAQSIIMPLLSSYVVGR